MSTHYATLGVAETATIEEIHQAHRRLVRESNPNRLTGRAKKKVGDRLVVINAAYNVLKNPERRREYDATLSPTAKARTSRSRSAPPKPSRSKPELRDTGIIARLVWLWLMLVWLLSLPFRALRWLWYRLVWLWQKLVWLLSLPFKALRWLWQKLVWLLSPPFKALWWLVCLPFRVLRWWWRWVNSA